MKAFFLFSLLLFSALASAQSDGSYPYFYQPTKHFTIDTSSNSETTTVLLPMYLGEQTGDEDVTWLIALANISDTSTVTIYVQQTLDPAAESTAAWVNTDTIATTYQMIASGTKNYLYKAASKGFRMRLQLVFVGTGTAKVRYRTWARVTRSLT